MSEFMFSVLGSVIFWILFFVVGFFAGTMVLKRINKKVFDFLIGKRGCPFDESSCMGELDWVRLIFLLIVIYLFWPIILVVLAIGFIIKHVLWKSFCSGVKAVDSVIPDIQFKKKDGE